MSQFIEKEHNERKQDRKWSLEEKPQKALPLEKLVI